MDWFVWITQTRTPTNTHIILQSKVLVLSSKQIEAIMFSID